MPLEHSDRIDIVAQPAPGRIDLIIVDAGTTEDPDQRFQLLVAKLQTYIAYVASDQFRQAYPGVGPQHVTIKVFHPPEYPPTERMSKIAKIRPHGDASAEVPVIFVAH